MTKSLGSIPFNWNIIRRLGSLTFSLLFAPLWNFFWQKWINALFPPPQGVHKVISTAVLLQTHSFLHVFLVFSFNCYKPFAPYIFLTFIIKENAQNDQGALIITSLNKLLILILNMKSYMHTMSSPIVGFPMVAWPISWLSWIFSRSQMSPDQGLSRSLMWLEDTTNQSVLPSTAHLIHLSQILTRVSDLPLRCLITQGLSHKGFSRLLWHGHFIS